MFLSIFAATCRPKNIVAFLDNLKQTCADPSSFEVLLKLDEGADDILRVLSEYKKNSPLCIKYLVTPKLEGYYTLDVGYNELLAIANPNTYFCWLLTDEIQLETHGWDNILKKYIGFFSDDIFRIKLSIFQLKNYNDLFECLPCPDNYAVTTRKWLEITGGWGNFWGPDSWHQCVDYYLSLAKNEFNPYGIWRSFPIFDIQIKGQEAGQGIENPQKLTERAKKIWLGWNKHSTHAAQENFNKLAQRLNAHIYAHEKKISTYCIHDELKLKKISLYNADTVNPRFYHSWNYTVPKFKISFKVGHKELKNVWLAFPKLYLIKFIRVFNRTHKVFLALKAFRIKAFVSTLNFINLFVGKCLSDIKHSIHKIKIFHFMKNRFTFLKFKKKKIKNKNRVIYWYDGKNLKKL